MEVDQPVVAQVEQSMQPSTPGTAELEAPSKSPGIIVQENDELPALVITDSEGEDPPVIDVDSQDQSVIVLKDGKKEPPIEEESPEQEKSVVEENVTLTVFENIDLTGVSSAEESGVSEPACETSSTNVEESEVKVVKDVYSLTAQELLHSLIGNRADDDDTLSDKEDEVVQPAECSDMIKFSDESAKQQGDQSPGDVTPIRKSDSVPSPPEKRLESTEDKCAENPEGLASNLKQIEQVSPMVSSELESQEKAAICEVLEEKNDKPIPQPREDISSVRQDAAAADSDDDILCLLEEMDDFIGFDKNADGNILDNRSLSSADSANSPAEGDEKQQKDEDNDGTRTKATSAVDTDNTSLEEFTVEPPTKRARSSQSPELDCGEIVARIESEDNKTYDSVNAGKEVKKSCEINSAKGDRANKEDQPFQFSKAVPVENQNEVEHHPTTSDRCLEQSSNPNWPSSSSVGDSIQNVTLLATSTTTSCEPTAVNERSLAVGCSDEGKQNMVKEDTTVKPTQCADVLVIEDDDDDDDADIDMDNDDGGRKASVNDCINKEIKKQCRKTPSPSDTEVRGKRARDGDSDDTTKKPKLDSASCSSSASKQGIADDVKQPKLMQLKAAEDVKPITLEFLKKFSKPLQTMTRDDLEELVLQKSCEALLYKSELVELRKQAQKMETMLQGFRQRLSDISKQYADLKLVHDRAVIDLKRKANRFVTPVKITRAVGLQVNVPPQITYQAFRPLDSVQGVSAPMVHPVGDLTVIPAATNSVAIDASNRQNSATAQAGTTAPEANMALRMAAALTNQQIPSGVLRTSIPMSIAFVHSPTAGAVTIRPTGPSRQQQTEATVVEPVPGSSSSPAPSISSVSTASGSPRSTVSNSSSVSCNVSSRTGSDGSGPSTSGSGTARKKTLHKITPMRPPLSAYQQEQQEHMARQQQELLLQEIQSQQASMAKLAARSKETAGEHSSSRSSSTMGDAAPTTRATATASRLSQSSSVSNVRAASNRSPSIVSSTTPSMGRQPGPTPTPPPPQSASFTGDSLIDLTDEDDTPRITTVAGSATMPAPNRANQNGTHPALPSELIAANQLNRLNQLARTAPKVLPYRPSGGANGGATSATTTAVSSGGLSMGGTMPRGVLLNNGTGIRPVLTKRPHGSTMQVVRMPPSMGRQVFPFVDPQVTVRTRPPIKLAAHPAPLPLPGPQKTHPDWKQPPPQPTIRINNVPKGIVISWSMPEFGSLHAHIENYQIYAYQETSCTPTPDAWRHVGDVNSLPLPMAVTLTHFHEGQRYHFAVRAIDEHKRVGHFSDPRTWNEFTTVQQEAN